MACNFNQYRNNVVYIIVVLILQGFYVYNVRGFTYSNETQSTLCDAQCEAGCLDSVANCTERCEGTRNWITNCDSPNCPGTCSLLFQNYRYNKVHLVSTPEVNISQSGTQFVELSWEDPGPVNNPEAISPYHIIYIIEKTHTDTINGIHSQSLIAWLTDTNYRLAVRERCNMDMYRVMAINQFGSSGYSRPIQLPGMRPGPVNNIKYTGRGIYYYENKNNPDQSQFMAILTWDPPDDWSEQDVAYYSWNPMVTRYCSEIEHDSLPIFMEMTNLTDHILMSIADNSIGCVFQAQVRAVSRCNVKGPWTNFTVDLTDCNSITGYRCEDRPFDPPGLVENVNLTVTSKSSDLQMAFYDASYRLDESPFIVFLHIKWQPPSDLGSAGVVDHYLVRSGRAERNLFPIPPAFIEEPAIKEAPNNTIELIFTLQTQSIPYTFGIQVIAVGPGQVIKDNEYGLFPMHTMEVTRNDSGLAAFIGEGKILLDKEGIVILYVNNTLPVHFLFDMPVGKMGNTTIDKYAVQWGPLVGPEANETMHIENATMLPSGMDYFSNFDDGPVPGPHLSTLIG